MTSEPIGQCSNHYSVTKFILLQLSAFTSSNVTPCSDETGVLLNNLQGRGWGKGMGEEGGGGGAVKTVDVKNI